MDAQSLGDMGELAALLASSFDPNNKQSQLSLRQRQGYQYRLRRQLPGRCH